MENEEKEIGFLIETSIKYGTREIVARLIGREMGKDYPVGIYSESFGPYALDGLGLYGHVYQWKTDPASYIGCEPTYQNVFSIDGRKAKKMAKTLDKVYARIAKDGAQEPGEIFLAMARALKLAFVVERNPRSSGIGSRWSDSDWTWYNIPDGKNLYVRRIADQLAEANGKAA